MLALVEYEAKICECGLHESEADQDPDLALDFRVCPVCAGLAQQMRVQTAIDDKTRKELGEKPPPEAPLPDDGRHIRLRRKIPEHIQRLLDAQATAGAGQ